MFIFVQVVRISSIHSDHPAVNHFFQLFLPEIVGHVAEHT